MAVSTVSTYALFQSTLNDVTKVESNLTTEQEQLSSDNAAQNFGQMADQTQQYLSLGNSIAQTTQYLNNHKVIEASVNTTNSVLTQVINTGNTLQSLLSQQISGITDKGAFFTQLQGQWQQLVSELNTNINGQYLFSGTRTGTPAVNATSFPTLKQSGVPDTGYYQGNQQDLTVEIQSGSSITYNVRADAPGFQKLFAGLAMAQQSVANNDTAGLQQAENFVQEGVGEITSMQATVASNAAQLATSDTNLNNTQLYWQGLQQSIGNTDIVSVSTQLSVNQGILQAAFQAFAKITSLRLSDYLK